MRSRPFAIVVLHRLDRLWLLHKLQRVLWLIVQQHRKVQVRAGGLACIANLRDGLPSIHFFAELQRDGAFLLKTQPPRTREIYQRKFRSSKKHWLEKGGALPVAVVEQMRATSMVFEIRANAYNPNAVPPTEMQLLIRSILEDGYTMPLVCYYLADEDCFEIVDDYHRYMAMVLTPEIVQREGNCLPISVIDKPLSNRIASTIRHNRARGVHSIDLMTNIVAQLVEAGLGDDWIMKNIGMDRDELLRLKQLSGLAALFADREFSKAWESDSDAP